MPDCARELIVRFSPRVLVEVVPNGQFPIAVFSFAVVFVALQILQWLFHFGSALKDMRRSISSTTVLNGPTICSSARFPSGMITKLSRSEEHTSELQSPTNL